jgi:hypothetical protein
MQAGKTRRLLATAACAGVALIAAGCGSSSSSASHSAAKTKQAATPTTVSPGLDPVAKAASVSTSAPGYKLSLAMQIKVAELPSPINATGVGSFSTAGRTGSMSLSLDLGSIPELGALLGTSSKFTINEVLDKTAVYLKLPSALTAHLPGGKPWLELDIAKLPGTGGLTSLFSSPAESNPGAMLQYLKAASGSISKVGTATVNGYPTTEYRATLDLNKYPSLVPAADRAAAKQAIAALEKEAGVSSLPVEIWIDHNNLVRRLAFDLDANTSQAGAVGINMTMDITDYGPQPTPVIPPARQVGSANALLSSAESAATTIG